MIWQRYFNKLSPEHRAGVFTSFSLLMAQSVHLERGTTLFRSAIVLGWVWWVARYLTLALVDQSWNVPLKRLQVALAVGGSVLLFAATIDALRRLSYGELYVIGLAVLGITLWMAFGYFLWKSWDCPDCGRVNFRSQNVCWHCHKKRTTQSLYTN